ncbi:MAG TPA: hypothetical protein VG673_21255 [Actinomycetota bacterium]|nr:hypothetical protein [Actinomycetota bacterium]
MASSTPAEAPARAPRTPRGLAGGVPCRYTFQQELPHHRSQRFPGPGLVRLGTIDTGLEVIAAGNDFELTIEPLD